jgi:hypothetical protein
MRESIRKTVAYASGSFFHCKLMAIFYELHRTDSLNNRPDGGCKSISRRYCVPVINETGSLQHSGHSQAKLSESLNANKRASRQIRQKTMVA